MPIQSNGVTKSFLPSLRFSVFFLLLLFLISYVIIYNLALSDQPGISETGALVKNIEDIDEYDAACSGYSVGRILREQKRILASVRLELSESELKIREIRAVQEELQRLIPQKQLELSALEGEIEAAQRQLEELRETRNVNVFLPFSPIQTTNTSRNFPTPPSGHLTLDDVIDYSRCSITAFMPIHIKTTSNEMIGKEWEAVFREVVGNIVENEEEACLKILITSKIVNSDKLRNTVIFNTGNSVEDFNTTAILVQPSHHRSFDYAIDASSTPATSFPLKPLLPLQRENLIALILEKGFNELDLRSLEDLEDRVVIRKCDGNEDQCNQENRELLFNSSTFCFLLPSDEFQRHFMDSLRHGCIPIIFSNTIRLPFQDQIDWRSATYRLPFARLPEAHFIVRSFGISDVLEMRRMGRVFYESYLANRKLVARTLIAALRHTLHIPTKESKSDRKNQAVPLFNDSFTPPKGSVVNTQANFDDEYLLGPLESRIESESFAHNFSEFQMYSYETWNKILDPYRSKEFFIGAAEPPAEAEFHSDTKIGFRPIEPGSGAEFSKALGGNRQREQFTAVLLTYERDTVLVGALERLHQLPYLNKVIVVWNNVHREPPDTWPSLHVPIEFIRVSENSLNNRFIPWDRIETEAVLSLDDDIDLMQQEIVLAFRVWRENRDRIVGFPARHHARFGDSMFYNSNHTCQMSMILTGAAFIHKNYLSAYTYQMPEVIRRHVDSIRNCEDIAMNYLVSHLTRKPPIKTTSRWTLKCPTCTESLFKEDTHFEKRHECMRFFTEIYGYNPLRFSQFRVDSILFKTRLPQNHQKCFKYV